MINGADSPRWVLDASALLAMIEREPGADRVRAAISDGAVVSAVNWAEILTKLVMAAGDPYEVGATTLPGGAGGGLELAVFDDVQARETARLVRYTRHLGLSLADRAALALAQQRKLPVLTTDRAWRSLRLPIKIEVIR